MVKRRSCFAAVVVTALWASVSASRTEADEIYQEDGAVVRYSAISQDYARAIGRVTAVARRCAAENFGFDMPKTVTVTVSVSPQGKTRLFNDGQDRISLTIRSEADLRKPSQSGIFHLYGLCHEVGHMAMYRPIRDHNWMTTAAAEGWAHYLGSRLVDAVYADAGEDLWPDRYDYRDDGMKRLLKQLASPEPSETAEGAKRWKDLIEIVGDRGAAPIFTAWGRARPDSADPADALGKALAAVNSDTKLDAWWQGARGTFVLKRPKSDFAAGPITRDQLVGQSEELARDDGRAAGKGSMAGGGHAVRFETDDNAWCVTSVRIHGARYGQPAAPAEDFRVWICDEDFQAIADFAYPYAKFARGNSRWVELPLKPVRVPQRFIVCVGFNPTATKGVFVSRDGKSSGESISGLPGSDPRPLASGDWMIRARVTRMKSSAAQSDTTTTDSAPATVLSSRLTGKPQTLSHDDGRQAGKKSIAGSGHAVRFETSDDATYLTQVRIYGARYGQPAPPREDFHVWLCDENFREIADFPFRYSLFQRAGPKWVSLKVRPTRVPRKFIICVGFNPTGTKGVFVGRDAESSGNSLTGLPGREPRPADDGDWMIRTMVDRLKTSAAPATMRIWTDVTGKFRTEAQFVGFKDGKVTLKKPDGTLIQVPLETLSAADRKLVKQK